MHETVLHFYSCKLGLLDVLTDDIVFTHIVHLHYRHDMYVYTLYVTISRHYVYYSDNMTNLTIVYYNSYNQT